MVDLIKRYLKKKTILVKWFSEREPVYNIRIDNILVEPLYSNPNRIENNLDTSDEIRTQNFDAIKFSNNTFYKVEINENATIIEEKTIPRKKYLNEMKTKDEKLYSSFEIQRPKYYFTEITDIKITVFYKNIYNYTLLKSAAK